MPIEDYFQKKSLLIDKALLSFLPKTDKQAPLLYEAMRFAVMSGGKRVRPVLALAACEAVGGDERKVMPAACAVEMIHSYSLIHDDLPCMDDDSFRRGKPTCHVKFGEATALLAGDALLTLAFKILSAPPAKADKAFLARQLETVNFVAEAVGAPGMVGGQAADLMCQGKKISLATLEYVNSHKSGALIAASVRAGAHLGGGTAAEVKSLWRYGRTLGLLFQIVDDILDGEGYAELLGPVQAQKEAQAVFGRAEKEISFLGKKGQVLSEITRFTLERKK